MLYFFVLYVFSYEFNLKEPVHHYTKSVLIKPTFHVCSNGLGPSSQKGAGE